MTDAIAKTPHAVLLLDEIEKAHPDVFNVLLQVMDHGTLTDNNGKNTDFRHVVLIMTSNVGARDLAQARVGFGERGDRATTTASTSACSAPSSATGSTPASRSTRSTRRSWASIVDKFMRELGGHARRQERHHCASRPARKAYLAEKGYDPQNGARPLARIIQNELKRPLGDELLFGQARADGGAVTVNCAKGALTFEILAPASEAAVDTAEAIG